MTSMRGGDQQHRQEGEVGRGPARSTVIALVVGLIVLVAVVLLIVWLAGGGDGIGGGY